MESLKFTITTKMEKEDLKKFMYIVTFFRKKSMIPMLVTISLLGSLWVNYAWGNVTTLGFFIVTMIMLIFIVGVICFKIERRVKQRIKTDNTGTLGSESVLRFYEEHLEMESESFRSHSELRYDQFYELMETKDFYMFYISVSQAYMVRKKDIKADECSAFCEFMRYVYGAKYKRLNV